MYDSDDEDSTAEDRHQADLLTRPAPKPFTLADQRRQTEEMRPQWYAYADVPYGHMWDDDRLWMPQLLAGADINGEFTFGADKKVKSYNLA